LAKKATQLASSTTSALMPKAVLAVPQKRVSREFRFGKNELVVTPAGFEPAASRLGI
jgi:hypothetical protein